MQKENYPSCDILNLEYNKLILLMKALNSTRTKRRAAQIIGISSRQILRWIAEYKIFQVRAANNLKYYDPKKKRHVSFPFQYYFAGHLLLQAPELKEEVEFQSY